MPTYQYACTIPDCGERFELVQSFTDPAASECPVCGGAVRKVFSAVGVVFKGSGFYRTDSRADASSGAKGSSSSESSESKSSESTSSEAKSADSKSKSKSSESKSSEPSGSSSKETSSKSGGSTPSKAAAPA